MTEDELLAYARLVAERRHALHVDHASSRPLSPDYEFVGLAGEVAFGIEIGMMPNFDEKPDGDGGIDFTVPLLFTVDVRTARKAGYLIHEEGKPLRADIYVLAEFDDDAGRAKLVGWEWANALVKAPTRDFGYGIINHYIHRKKLRPMESLTSRVAGLRAKKDIK